jgi:hypothetical protein
MVLDNGTSRALEESQALRDLYDRLLDSLLDAYTTGNCDRMLHPFLNTADGHGLAWRYGDRVRCAVCSGSAWHYERLGSRGVASLVFCPTCRALFGADVSGRRIVHSIRRLDTLLDGALPTAGRSVPAHDADDTRPRRDGRRRTTKQH